MAKTHLDSTSKGTLYGIRFNQKTGVSHWVTPYAWLNHGDDWYLVKYLTPTFFVKWFPFLMNMVSHEAWKVDKKEIFDNPEFQIPDDEATLKQPEDKLGASKYTIGIVGGPIVAGLLYKLTGMFLSTNDKPSYGLSLLILLLSFVIYATIFIVLIYIWFRFNKNVVNRRPELNRNIVATINLSKTKEIALKIPIIFNTLPIVALKYLSLIFGLIPWLLFIDIIIHGNRRQTSTDLALDGLALAVFTILFIVPSFIVYVFKPIWHQINLKEITIEEGNK